MAMTTGLHSDYIKRTIGPILVLCLHEVSEIQPQDPIDYIARWLYSQSNNLIFYHTKIRDIVDYDQARLKVAAEEKKRQRNLTKLRESLTEVKKKSKNTELEIEEALRRRQQIIEGKSIALAAKRNFQLKAYENDQKHTLLLTSNIKFSAEIRKKSNAEKPQRWSILLPTFDKTSTTSISVSKEEEETLQTSSEWESSSSEESEVEGSAELEEEEEEQDYEKSIDVEMTETQRRAEKQRKIKEQQHIKTIKKALDGGKAVDLKNMMMMKKFVSKTKKEDKKKLRRASSLPSVLSAVSKDDVFEESSKIDIVKASHHKLKIKHKTLIPQGRMGIRSTSGEKTSILSSTTEVKKKSVIPDIVSLPRPKSQESYVHSDTDLADPYELFKKTTSFLAFMEEEHAEPENKILEKKYRDRTYSPHKEKGKRKYRELKTENTKGIRTYSSSETSFKTRLASSQISKPNIHEDDFQTSETEDFSKSEMSLTETQKMTVIGDLTQRVRKTSAHEDETARVETVKRYHSESALSFTDEEIALTALEELEEGMEIEEEETIEEVEEKMKLPIKKYKTRKKHSRRSLLNDRYNDMSSKHMAVTKSKKPIGKRELSLDKNIQEKLNMGKKPGIAFESKDFGTELAKSDNLVSGDSISTASQTLLTQRSKERLDSDEEELTATGIEWEETELQNTMTHEKYKSTRIRVSLKEKVERKTEEYLKSSIQSRKESIGKPTESEKAGRFEKKQRQHLVPQLVTWRCNWRQQLVCEHPALGDLVPRPPLLPTENVVWRENQEFIPQVLIDDEIYTRENDDEVSGHKDTALSLNLQHFLGPGPWMADLEQKIQQPSESTRRETKSSDDIQSVSRKEKLVKNILEENKKKRGSKKSQSDNQPKASEKKIWSKNRTANKTSSADADRNNNASLPRTASLVIGLSEEISMNNGNIEEEEGCDLEKSKRYSFSNTHSIFLTSDVESKTFATNAAWAKDQTRNSCIIKAIKSPSKRPGHSDEALQQRKLSLLDYFDESDTKSFQCLSCTDAASESNGSLINHLKQSKPNSMTQYQKSNSLNGESNISPHLTILPNTHTCPWWNRITKSVTREAGVSNSNGVPSHRNIKNKNGKDNKSNWLQGEMATSCKNQHPDCIKSEDSKKYMSLKQFHSSKLTKTDQSVISFTPEAQDNIITAKGKKEPHARREVPSQKKSY